MPDIQHQKRAASIILCTAMLLLSHGCQMSTGNGYPCHAPEGTYRVTLQDREPTPVSTCSDAVDGKLQSSYDVYYDGGDSECDLDSVAQGDPVPVGTIAVEGEEDCRVWLASEGNPTADGIEPGPATVEVVCSQRSYCRHDFNATFELVE